ncbi:hypothetical protein DPMN_076755 [Dreissena polymorpha]|uniref:Uncharacterized protein n=1 Tax=Dreissena polymorpha TaxID=45954 RepID=A0A9D3YJ98_DREPO|nr:hypothetical protein DPMN_076755 [Dreissena polymorpha]
MAQDDVSPLQTVYPTIGSRFFELTRTKRNFFSFSLSSQCLFRKMDKKSIALQVNMFYVPLQG